MQYLVRGSHTPGVVRILAVFADSSAYHALRDRLEEIAHESFILERAADCQKLCEELRLESHDLYILDEVQQHPSDIRELEHAYSATSGVPLVILREPGTPRPHISLNAGALYYFYRDEFENVELARCLRQSIRARKVNTALAYRVEAERLINEISTTFIQGTSENIDVSIDAALAILGDFVKADRAYIWHYLDGDTRQKKTHDWTAVGMDSPYARQSVAEVSEFPYITSEIRQGRAVKFSKLSELPTQAVGERQMFAGARVRSFIGVPLVAREQVIGFLGLSAVRCEVHWGSEVQRILFAVAKIFMNAFQRRQVLQELRESEARFRSVVESVNVGLAIYDTSGVAEYISPQFLKITGFGEDELRGKRLFEVLLGNDKVAYLDRHRMVKHHRNFGLVQEYELQFSRKDGERRWFEITTAPFRGRAEAIVGTVATFADITDRKQLENQFLHAQKMEAVGRLAAGVAHDFNNMLTAVLGYSGLLLNQLSEGDSYHREISLIRKASEQGTALVEQLLTFSRKQVTKPKLLSLNKVVDETTSMLKRLIGEDIDLRTNLSPSLGSLRADPTHMQQIILNLAINARDAMPDGGTLTIQTTNFESGGYLTDGFPAVPPGRYVMLTVIDTGIGMSAEVKQHLFEPFFTTKEQGKGTGLGLSTVYGVVKQAGGFLAVFSQLGQGSTFRVFLPRVEGRIEDVEVSAEAASRLRGDETILLVEDDPSVRILLKEVLEMQGYHVFEASNGEEAITFSSSFNSKIDLLVTDVVMPHVGGCELARSLRHQRPEIRVLIISGYLDDPAIADRLGTDDFAFLNKPFTPSTFTRQVRSLLDAHVPPRGSAMGSPGEAQKLLQLS